MQPGDALAFRSVYLMDGREAALPHVAYDKLVVAVVAGAERGRGGAVEHLGIRGMLLAIPEASLDK